MLAVFDSPKFVYCMGVTDSDKNHFIRSTYILPQISVKQKMSSKEDCKLIINMTVEATAVKKKEANSLLQLPRSKASAAAGSVPE